MGLLGVTTYAPRMKTTGTTTNNAHWAGLRRPSRQAARPEATDWARGEPEGAACRWGRARRVRAATSDQAARTAPTVQATAQPRSPMRPPCPEGRSTIQSVTKCVGSKRVATWSAALIAGPKNTSRIQTTSTMIVPFSGLRVKALHRAMDGHDGSASRGTGWVPFRRVDAVAAPVGGVAGSGAPGSHRRSTSGRTGS